MKILITGGAGFIGSNFIRYMHGKYPDYQVVNLDKLTYAGNLESLEDISQHSFYRFIKGDIADAFLVNHPQVLFAVLVKVVLVSGIYETWRWVV